MNKISIGQLIRIKIRYLKGKSNKLRKTLDTFDRLQELFWTCEFRAADDLLATFRTFVC